MAESLIENYGGQVPDDYDALASLPGRRKNGQLLVLSVGFGHQRIAVDTRVFRVANRIGLTSEKDVLRDRNFLSWKEYLKRDGPGLTTV